jgi:hypothetical protein
VLTIDDLHTCPGATAPGAPMMELVRALVSSGRFIGASDTETTVQQLGILASAQTLGLSAADSAGRLRCRMCSLHIVSPPAAGPLFAAQSRSVLGNLCQAFADSIRDALGSSTAKAFAHKAAALLAIIVKDASEESTFRETAQFDMESVRRVLCRVHADVTQEPLDYVAAAVKRKAMGGALQGSALLAVFGNLAQEDSRASGSSADSKVSSSAAAPAGQASTDLRSEHLWLLLASETVQELATCLAPAAVERLRGRLVGLVDAQLQRLVAAYDAHAAAAASVAASTEALWRDAPPAAERAGSGAASIGTTRSSLLQLAKSDTRRLAHVAVMHGVIAHVDGPQPSQRVVLPLHLEVFQVLLLQSLTFSEEHAAQVRLR